MNQVFVKLRMRGNSNKYRKMLSTENDIYGSINALIESSFTYAPGASLQPGEWFKIPNFSQKEFAIDVTKTSYETVDYDSLQKQEYGQIDYLFVKMNGNFYFQNMSKSRLVRKKHILEIGEGFQYIPEADVLTINEYPDAIYVPEEDALYFQRLETVSGIFKGMEDLYREATTAEVTDFLNSDFITLTDDFGTSQVKTLNRKRIALAKDIISNMRPEEQHTIFAYIKDYCPGLSTDTQKFNIGSDEDLKMLLYGIEQRFYTTPVGHEQRVANSTIPLRQQGGSHGQAQNAQS